MYQLTVHKAAARVAIGVLPDGMTAARLVAVLARNGADDSSTLFMTGKPTESTPAQLTSNRFSLLAELEEMLLWRTNPSSDPAGLPVAHVDRIAENVGLLFRIAHQEPRLFCNIYHQHLKVGRVLILHRLRTPIPSAPLRSVMILSHSTEHFQVIDVS